MCGGGEDVMCEGVRGENVIKKGLVSATYLHSLVFVGQFELTRDLRKE